MTLTVHQLPTNEIVCRVVVTDPGEASWEAYHQTRESRHLGGGEYTPGSFVARDERGKVVDRFGFDCEGASSDAD